MGPTTKDKYNDFESAEHIEQLRRRLLERAGVESTLHNGVEKREEVTFRKGRHRKGYSGGFNLFLVKEYLEKQVEDVTRKKMLALTIATEFNNYIALEEKKSDIIGNSQDGAMVDTNLQYRLVDQQIHEKEEQIYRLSEELGVEPDFVFNDIDGSVRQPKISNDLRKLHFFNDDKFKALCIGMTDLSCAQLCCKILFSMIVQLRSATIIDTDTESMTASVESNRCVTKKVPKSTNGHRTNKLSIRRYPPENPSKGTLNLHRKEISDTGSDPGVSPQIVPKSFRMKKNMLNRSNSSTPLRRRSPAKSNNDSYLRRSGSRNISGSSRSQSPDRSTKNNQKKKMTDAPTDGNNLPEQLRVLGKDMVEKIENEILDESEPVTFEDIAGLENAKQTVKELVCWPMKRPDMFTGLRKSTNGLLLFGPPGTGKTLIGKAIAFDSGATFFSISSSTLTSKWFGEGEKLVRTLFAVASYREPAIVFIDEIDSLLSQRKGNENEASRRIKTEFLVQLDGTSSSFSSSSESPQHTQQSPMVLVIGATNRPYELDDAARRRFVKRVYIPLPEQSDRECLLRNLLKKNNHRITKEQFLKLSVDTHGFSGADLKALCTDAALGPIRQLGELALVIDADDIPPICYEHFRSALQGMNPSVAQSDLDVYIEWNEKYGSNSVAFPSEKTDTNTERSPLQLVNVRSSPEPASDEFVGLSRLQRLRQYRLDHCHSHDPTTTQQERGDYKIQVELLRQRQQAQEQQHKIQLERFLLSRREQEKQNQQRRGHSLEEYQRRENYHLVDLTPPRRPFGFPIDYDGDLRPLHSQDPKDVLTKAYSDNNDILIRTPTSPSGSDNGGRDWSRFGHLLHHKLRRGQRQDRFRKDFGQNQGEATQELK